MPVSNTGTDLESVPVQKKGGKSRKKKKKYRFNLKKGLSKVMPKVGVKSKKKQTMQQPVGARPNGGKDIAETETALTDRAALTRSRVVAVAPECEDEYEFEGAIETTLECLDDEEAALKVRTDRNEEGKGSTEEIKKEGIDGPPEGGRRDNSGKKRAGGGFGLFKSLRKAISRESGDQENAAVGEEEVGGMRVEGRRRGDLNVVAEIAASSPPTKQIADEHATAAEERAAQDNPSEQAPSLGDDGNGAGGRERQQEREREALHTKKEKKGIWKATVDSASGKTYYYHTLTKKTTWEKPTDYQERLTRDDKAGDAQKDRSIKDNDMVVAGALNLNFVQATAAAAAAAVMAMAGVAAPTASDPPKKTETDMQQTFNSMSGILSEYTDGSKTTYESKDESKITDVSINVNGNVWKVYGDKKSGKHYYYNKVTKVTQWEVPEECLPKDESAGKENRNEMPEECLLRDEGKMGEENREEEMEVNAVAAAESMASLNPKEELEEPYLSQQEPSANESSHALEMMRGEITTILTRISPDDADLNQALLEKFAGQEAVLLAELHNLIDALADEEYETDEEVPFDEREPRAIKVDMSEFLKDIEKKAKTTASTTKDKPISLVPRAFSPHGRALLRTRSPSAVSMSSIPLSYGKTSNITTFTGSRVSEQTASTLRASNTARNLLETLAKNGFGRSPIGSKIPTILEVSTTSEMMSRSSSGAVSRASDTLLAKSSSGVVSRPSGMYLEKSPSGMISTREQSAMPAIGAAVGSQNDGSTQTRTRYSAQENPVSDGKSTGTKEILSESVSVGGSSSEIDADGKDEYCPVEEMGTSLHDTRVPRTATEVEAAEVEVTYADGYGGGYAGDNETTTAEGMSEGINPQDPWGGEETDSISALTATEEESRARKKFQHRHRMKKKDQRIARRKKQLDEAMKQGDLNGAAGLTNDLRSCTDNLGTGLDTVTHEKKVGSREQSL